MYLTILFAADKVDPSETSRRSSFLYSSLGFDPVKDFEPIILVGSFPMVIATTPNTQFSTIPDILKAAKASSEVITKLNLELQKFLAMPETRKRLLELGYDAGGG